MLATQLDTTYQQVASWFFHSRRSFDSADGSTIVYGRLTLDQKWHLEKWINENNQELHPSRIEACKLAGLIGSSTYRVQRWFYSQRRRTTVNKTSRAVMPAITTETLEKSFQCNAYPDRATKEKLAATLEILIQTVTNWFNHRRKKEKQL